MPEAPVPGAPAAEAPTTEADQPAASPRRVGLALLLGLLVLLGAGALKVSARLDAEEELREVTASVAVPSVRVILPRPVEPRPLALPGRLQAWAEAPVYARTNGFVARRLADIGDRVQAGQVLALIDTPDLDQQLAAAEAAVGTARAQRDLAARTAQRWNELSARNVVSQQATDERRGDLAARTAQLSQAEAEVNRLRALTGFKQVTAPFDGVVTSRAIDVGGLIVSGSTSTPPLFTVTDMSHLRLYVRVPQAYTGSIRQGMKAEFTVPEYPDRSFTAELTRTADAVDAQSGAMLVQFTVDNPDGALKPGGYAQVRLELPPQASAAPQLRVPASALIFRASGTSIAVVDGEGRVTVKPVRIARDLGAVLDIASGLEPGDRVIDSPSDAIRSGDQVRPAEVQG
ncbi:efflux RND transporter periplasmic adaptor subunit [Siccirubricoccus sp. KC 17139]|uniref:Efflux RND transporter periplasmic adaptor subunit n=1 Tax=Siccirubricoccus soli TaxID=2899147 RepID=A0ABT1D6G4_9PROT|nr:efflux RND transporter periplasmic adaptor subunit [Siccirubricoccus soli]MCO6417469.1 efflux RND transporter periplasmic adaptor subunit [Siccirubricoccus soli]MCP2683604.1 efflux RND transporter periplasmic adaptor subunit [Siccirubricoccus soli]